MKYQKYSNEFKEAILKKLSQSDLSVSKLSQQEGINLSMLYSWQKQFKTSGLSVPKANTADKWSAEEKFSVVLETATLSEIEVSKAKKITAANKTDKTIRKRAKQKGKSFSRNSGITGA